MLLADLGRGDTTALGQLYDRYGAAMYALVRQRHPAAAEAVVEQVFLELWNTGQRNTLALPIVPLLIDLVARTLWGSNVPAVLSTHQGAAEDALSLLLHIGRSEPIVCSVLLLVRLGRLTITESAAALEVEPAVVRHALTVGLGLLRQVQPIATAEATIVREQSAVSGGLSSMHALVVGGGESAVQQPAQ